MGSVGSDELLVARQADDGGAGELLRRHGAAGGRRGVGQVPRRHGLEEPLGRRRAWGRSTVRARSKLRFAAVPTNVVAASGSHMAKSSMPTA